MSVEEIFGNLFKPEVRSSGRKLLKQEKIKLGSQSETTVQAYARVTPAFKITLSAEDVTSSSFEADCSCPVAKKSRFCKHIWGTLLAIEDEYPDFLIGKTEINQAVVAETTPTQETHKARASEYRKEQYQKQKARIKDKKRAQKGIEEASQNTYDPEVTAAMAYFSKNGFPMPMGPSREVLAEAKRTLSRVFHPDKGGSHEESVELNRNCEVILNLFR